MLAKRMTKTSCRAGLWHLQSQAGADGLPGGRAQLQGADDASVGVAHQNAAQRGRAGLRCWRAWRIGLGPCKKGTWRCKHHGSSWS